MDVESLSPNYRVQKLTEADINIILDLSQKNTVFYEYHPPFVSADSILEDIRALPPGKTYNDKFYIGFFDDEILVAVMDLILDYPQIKTAFIGLFMMNMDFQGRGVGSSIIQNCAVHLARLGYRTIQLGIDKGNPQSEAFWTKNGFTKTGREVPNEFSAYLYMERTL